LKGIITFVLELELEIVHNKKKLLQDDHDRRERSSKLI